MKITFICYIYCLDSVMSQQQADAEDDYMIGVEPEEINYRICASGMTL